MTASTNTRTPARVREDDMRQALAFAQLPDEGLISVPAVTVIAGMGESTVWRQLGKDGFPAPVRVGKRSTRIRVGDLRAWLRTRGAA
jgi:predicted DNA-binding transcriptional regulator AlpA